MDFLFEHFLYKESLCSPKNLSAGAKNIYPGLKDQQLLSALGAMGITIKQSRLEKADGTTIAVIRYNAQNGTAFGGTDVKDGNVPVIAITNMQNQQGQDRYTVHIGTVADIPQKDGSWNLSKTSENPAGNKWAKKENYSLDDVNTCIVDVVQKKLGGV